MNRRDIYIGMTVYHTIFPHFGAGKVKATRRVDALGYRTAEGIQVEWPDKKEGNKVIWHHVGMLRKTFNQKKADLIAGLRARRNTTP